MKSIRLVILVLLVPFALSSCLDIHTEIELRSDGSAQLQATYDISREVWERGVFDHDNPNRVIPVSRRDIEELAALWDGVELERYRIRENETRVRVEFRLAIADPEALANVWAGVSDRLAETSFSPADRTVGLPLTTAHVELDTEAADLVRDELRDGRYRLDLTTPAPIVEIVSPVDGRYLLPDGGVGTRTVGVEGEIADFVLDPRPYVLELRWE